MKQAFATIALSALFLAPINAVSAQGLSQPKESITTPDAQAATQTSVASMSADQVPINVEVVNERQESLGTASKVLTDKAGKVTAVVVIPAGQTDGKKVPASQLRVSGGKLIASLDKAAFNKLPKAS
jgi:hypothetical protein